MSKKPKIFYFPPNSTKDTILNYNGKALDKYFISGKTKENVSNGNYTLDITFTRDVYQYLQHETVIKVQMDYGYEYFRITKLSPTKNYVDVVGIQISQYDAMTLYLDDVRPTNKNAIDTFSYLLTNAKGTKKDITLTSTIATGVTAYYVDKTLNEAICSADNSMMNNFYAEIRRRGYEIQFNRSVGKTQGLIIRDKKNLISIEGNSTCEGILTCVKGKGYNGIEGNWIDSPLKSSYDRVYYGIIEFSDVKVGTGTGEYATEAEAIAELDRRVALKYSEEYVDVADETYNIDFLDIYDRVQVGDTIKCISKQLNTIVQMRVIEREFDIGKQMVTAITVSSKPSRYSKFS